MQFMLTQAHPDALLLDIGAHAGLYTVNLYDKVARCVCVEAHPETYEVLAKNVAGLDSVKTIPAAAWHNEDGASLFPRLPGQHYVAGHPGENSILVPSVTVDSLEPEFTGPLLVKIDVEGAEVNVLRGMANLLKRCNPIAMVIEIWASHLTRNHHTCQDIYDILSDFQAINPGKKKAMYRKEI